MNISDQASSPLSLKEVKAKFEHWRSTRIKRGRIPEILWQQVLTLTKKYSAYELSKALSLNNVEIKARMQSNLNPLSSEPITDTKELGFVEINMPSPIEESHSYSKISKIELKRPDGASIFIEHLEQKILMQILTQFMEGLKC